MLSYMLLAALCVLPLPQGIVAQGVRQYTVKNHCPTSINLYIGGNLDSVLPVGGTVTRTLGVNAGFFYTDANGGTKDGAATKAGFFGDNNSFYYYIVKDVTSFNTGLRITPNKRPVKGFCGVDSCTSVDCPNAYTEPPTGFPPATHAPPMLPNYACPFSDVAYTITFCPGGDFPTTPVVGRSLNPNGNKKKCMDVQGRVFANGTPVQIYDCNETPAQKFIFNRGNTKIQVANTNFCLDAGSSPASGIKMKIWQCYDNLPAQQWTYTDDNRLRLNSANQCIDLTDGVLKNSNPLQTWQCYPGNTNQIWTTAHKFKFEDDQEEEDFSTTFSIEHFNEEHFNDEHFSCSTFY